MRDYMGVIQGDTGSLGVSSFKVWGLTYRVLAFRVVRLGRWELAAASKKKKQRSSILKDPGERQTLNSKP